MAIPSRQIGWSTKANLLWQISKQLEYLTCVTAGGCGTTTTTSTVAPSTTTTTTTLVPLVEITTGYYAKGCVPCVDVCIQNEITIYTEQVCSDNITIGCHIYSDALGTINAPEGYYVRWDGVEGLLYIDANGLVLNIDVCPQIEYYDVNDCIGSYGSFTSVAYPIGTFAVNDMVTFTTGQGDAFGFILYTTQEAGGDIAITATGTNQGGECALSNIYFQPEVDPDGTYITLRLKGLNNGPEELESLGLNALNYNYDFEIYYESNVGNGYINIAGNIPISFYVFEKPNWDFGVFNIYTDPEQNFTYIEVQNMITSITFENTIAYSNDGGCLYPYFLRESPEVKTFYCYTQNDDC